MFTMDFPLRELADCTNCKIWTQVIIFQKINNHNSKYETSCWENVKHFAKNTIFSYTKTDNFEKKWEELTDYMLYILTLFK